jgi:hypothetical protein
MVFINGGLAIFINGGIWLALRSKGSVAGVVSGSESSSDEGAAAIGGLGRSEAPASSGGSDALSDSAPQHPDNLGPDSSREASTRWEQR